MSKDSIIFTLLLLFIPAVSLPAAARETADSVVSAAPEQIVDSVQAFSRFLDDTRREALEAILPNYNDWETAELSGKLRLKKLPLSPTVRIFMKKGEEISISVRASFLGEVGRIEIWGDSILAVNKMKRVYCEESISGIKYDYPDIIADVQSLLLGRAVALHGGELSADNADFFDFSVYAADGGDDVSAQPEVGGWSLSYPRGRSDEDAFGYSYRINPLGLVENLLVELSAADHDMSLSLAYSYPGKGFDLDIAFSKDYTQKFNALVEFGAVHWGASVPAPVSLNSKYTRLGIKQFLKSF